MRPVKNCSLMQCNSPLRWLSSSQDWRHFSREISSAEEGWVGTLLHSLAVLGPHVSINPCWNFNLLKHSSQLFTTSFKVLNVFKLYVCLECILSWCKKWTRVYFGNELLLSIIKLEVLLINFKSLSYNQRMRTLFQKDSSS